MSLDLQLFAALLVTVATLVLIRNRKRSAYPLPPGPQADSIFGNSWPTAFGYRHFEKWTQEYGPVFSLRQGFSTIIVIGRLQAAVDIMEKEGASLADRPRSIAAGETLSGGMRLLMTPLGDRFKKMRRALHSHLQAKSVSASSPVLMQAAKTLLLDIVANPDKHQENTRKYAASVVMALAYGKVPQRFDDPIVQSVLRCLTLLGYTMRPGAWKVDAYPILKYIPGYLKPLKDAHQEELNLFKGQLKEVEAKVQDPETVQKPCFSTYVLENQQSLGLTEDEASYLVGSMFGAGSDTQASAISVALMAAATHPKEQALLHEELDRIVGRGRDGRPPTYEDKDRLIRCMAFVTESFRWRPVTSGGFPHKAVKDVVWQNYLIPAGSTVIGNVWSVGRDPEFFPDPETFNPSRWLIEDPKLPGEYKLRDDIKSYPFGFGRRICPGKEIATASVLINTALILWAFRISEDSSHPIDTLAFTESANAHPLPFHLRFEPRFDFDDGLEKTGALKQMLEGYGMAL